MAREYILLPDGSYRLADSESITISGLEERILNLEARIDSMVAPTKEDIADFVKEFHPFYEEKKDLLIKVARLNALIIRLTLLDT